MAVCRGPNQSHGREVLPVFEPSWTARACLQTAYECLIPVQRRSTSITSIPQSSGSVEQPTSQSAKLPNTTSRRSAA